MDINNLLALLETDKQFEGYQGVHFNSDRSMLVIKRWGSHLYANPDAYLEDLRKRQEAAAQKAAVQA